MVLRLRLLGLNGPRGLVSDTEHLMLVGHLHDMLSLQKYLFKVCCLFSNWVVFLWLSCKTLSHSG